MREAYSILAQFYDASIGVDYESWVDYLLSLMKHFNHNPTNIIDIGCGTGNLTILLAEKGYQLTGVDISREMIELAVAKATKANLNIAFSVQDQRNLDMPQSFFDTAISTCDVLNYLLTLEDLSTAVEKVAKVLKPGGLWLCDLNSTKKLQQIYGDESYADLQDHFAYFWDNSYDWERQITSMELTFFVQNHRGFYERITEQHKQKLWLPKDLKEIGKKFGFSVLGSYDFLTMDSCGGQSERWQFVLRKN